MLNGIEKGEAVVVGTWYTTIVLPEVVNGIVPEIPFSDAQVNTGTAGNTVQTVDAMELDNKHMDSPTAWAFA